MDKDEAKAILHEVLKRYRSESYVQLQRLLEEQDTSDVTAESGVVFQLEIEALWDDKPGQNLRVWGAIDDGGMRAFVPLVECFIISPSGEFIGE